MAKPDRRRSSRDTRISAAKRGYDRRWQRYRIRYLRENPLCVKCERAGRTTAANTVDHIIPHRGDEQLFWDPTNHQGLCGTCHNADKQRFEKSGVRSYRGCSADGTPLDPDHHWQAARSGNG